MTAVWKYITVLKQLIKHEMSDEVFIEGEYTIEESN